MGDHYSIIFPDRDAPEMRWDFSPAPQGSKAELLSAEPLPLESRAPKAIRDCL